MRFEDLKADYADKWARLELSPDTMSVVEGSATRVTMGRARYEAIEAVTGVPWHVIGTIHKMECNCSFKEHLHCGDPLTARTKRVPKGRPVVGKPPFTWEESAVDALRYDGLDKITDWSPERIAYALEKYNGFGSRRHGVPSAYLWSMTRHYGRGKYVADGKWDPWARSQQSGGMAILYVLCLRGVVVFDKPSRAAEPEKLVVNEAENLPRVNPPTAVQTAVRSKSLWVLINAKILLAVGVFTDWLHQMFQWVLWTLGVLPAVKSEVGQAVEQTEQLSTWLKLDGTRISFGVVLVALVVVFVRHLNDKRKMEGGQ